MRTKGGVESVVLDSLLYNQSSTSDLTFLLAGFKHRQVREDIRRSRRACSWTASGTIRRPSTASSSWTRMTPGAVVSVGSDGKAIMVWALDLEPLLRPHRGRDPSPEKGSFSSARPPLRRVLSKALSWPNLRVRLHPRAAGAPPRGCSAVLPGLTLRLRCAPQ